MSFSMTGFGSASLLKHGFQVKCDLQCLNKKNLEISISLPKYCMALEIPFRKTLESQLKRGKVSAYFEIGYRKSRRKMVLDEPLLQSWNEALDALAKKYKYTGRPDLETWIAASPIWRIEEDPVPQKYLEEVLNEVLLKALEQLLKMRRREGKHLEKDIGARVKSLEQLLNRVRKRGLVYCKNYEKNIRNKVSSSGQFKEGEIDLFKRFVAVFTDKGDISEEITRLGSHLKQMRHYLPQTDPVGRSLDFLLQECNREINTIGSKLNDLEGAGLVVEMKTLAEQIREQVQNIL